MANPTFATKESNHNITAICFSSRASHSIPFCTRKEGKKGEIIRINIHFNSHSAKINFNANNEIMIKLKG